MANNEEDFLEEIESETEDKEIDTAPYKINTYGADWTIEILNNKLNDKEIIVPPFQRRYVWPPKKASKLVESFLLGLPVPQIFLYRVEESQDLLVVDGQQRLKSIQYFFNGKFEDGSDFFLRGVKPTWEGKTYKTLSEPDRRRFKNSILRTTIFEQTDPKDQSSVFEIFERLNTGGMALTPQEIRNCVIQGEINILLKELNEYRNWRDLLRKEQPDNRMRDTEIILRFLALYKRSENYTKPMKDFITYFMKDNKHLSDDDKQEYSTLFKSVVDKIHSEIGTSAFKIKAGINVALLDSVMVAVARIGPTGITNLRERYNKLMANQSYLESISKSTTDKERVERRINIAIETFSK